VVRCPPAFAQREFGFDNTKPSGQPYLKPEESLKRMKVADGFEVHLAAAEPDVINPIAFTLDEKGRIWVVECFEYPKRTAKGKMPRDRIKILESTKGDGVYDKVTIFAEGKDFPVPFDLASGIEVGNGGVYLGAPPYLWFIENKNDKPGKFEILLKGFGSQDTHEMLNTFQWGPDGWLYGLHGVFTQSEVVEASGRRQPPLDPKQPGDKQQGADAPRSPVKMNAAVWRFHPKTKKFEIFAEGTSNPWGMDWRNTDGQFILCCCVIPHLYHIVPGGIYRRQAGTSANPYAYGEIKEICDHTFHKESGWAHAGLISLDAPHIPEPYRESVIFGSIHGCSIKRNVLKKNGSTFTASRADDFLISGDKNFRPINMKWGPSGEIYVIDWHDQNPCHQAAPDAWDYEHGRIFRIQVKGTPLKKAEDLSTKSAEELVHVALSDLRPWQARTALRLVQESPLDPEKLGGIQLNMTDPSQQLRFANVSAALLAKAAEIKKDPNIANTGMLRMATNFGPSETLNVWALRNTQPGPRNSEEVIRDLTRFAAGAKTPLIRAEAAGAAIRFGRDIDALPIVRKLLLFKEDAQDPVIPQLLWIALEPSVVRNRDDLLQWLVLNGLENRLVVDYMLPRIMRRLVATDKADDLAACVAFVGDVKDSAVRKRALEGLAEAVKGRQFDAPPRWQSVSAESLKDADPNVQRLARSLAVNFRDPVAVKRALDAAGDSAKPIAERLDAVRAVAVMRPDDGLRLLLHLLKDETSVELRTEAMRALAGYDDKTVSSEILGGWAKYPAVLRAEAANTLASRKEWAKDLLNAVGAKKVARTDLTDNTILRIRSFNDRNLNQQIETVWGKFRATPKDLEALINKMRGTLYEGGASFAKGKIVFEAQCAKCHKFEGRGADVGPPLDGAGRDIEYLLINVLDPNRVIGQPYFVHVVERKNGTNEIGLLAAEDAQTITLKGENGVQKVIAKKDVESHTVQEKSMMPEGLAAGMTTQDFRDLVRYVMANPFITAVTVNGKATAVGPPGRIVLPASKGEATATVTAEVTAPAAAKSRLLLGGSGSITATVNGVKVCDSLSGGDRPDHTSVEVALQAGTNAVKIEVKYLGKKPAVYARFLDPDRKLRYPEPERR
jgi:putative membrane-bound dehydrogenase-like protein